MGGGDRDPWIVAPERPYLVRDLADGSAGNRLDLGRSPRSTAPTVLAGGVANLDCHFVPRLSHPAQTPATPLTGTRSISRGREKRRSLIAISPVPPFANPLLPA